MQDKVMNKRFKITSPESVDREITLTDNMSDTEIKSWEFKNESGSDILVLKGTSSVYCKLKYANGVFQGRDIRGGFTVLRPVSEEVDKMRSAMDPPRREVPTRGDMRKVMPFDKYQQDVDIQVDQFTKTSDKAIAIVGCNRPQYMKQVIAGLKKSDLDDYDIYLFLDKPKDERYLESTQIQERMALSNRIVKYPFNFGCGRTLIDVRRQMFHRLGYEKAFIFEDDMVPASGYIQYCENLLEWSQQYSNVGAVQGWTKCLLTPEEKAGYTKQVHVTYTNWWGYLMTSDAWNEISQFLYTYRDKFLTGDYAVRSTVPILQYFKPHAMQNFQLKPGGISPDAKSLQHRRKIMDNPPSGQDGATWVAFEKAQLVRLAPTINRGLYIGESGIHSTPKLYKQDKFDKMTLDSYTYDRRRKKFELR